MIRCEHLSKTFHVTKKVPGLAGSLRALVYREKVRKEAVRDVSFQVAEGEIVGLVGANGAGKTTLVKMLAGIVHPSAGEANVLGYRPWERDDRFRSQIALIMGQKAQLWWDLPAEDCFQLLKEIYRIPAARYRENLGYLAAVLGVERELRIQLRRLSLGERMKMELIAALLHSPRVVFLDEPTIGLDLSAQRSIREFLLAYRREHRPAMLLTSHYMEDIERLCERILILREGRLVYDGSLARVAERHGHHKIVTAHLRREVSPNGPVPSLDDLGVVVERDEARVRVRVAREDVARSAAAILDRLPVADITIEGEDIGTIIEDLQRAGTASVA